MRQYYQTWKWKDSGDFVLYFRGKDHPVESRGPVPDYSRNEFPHNKHIRLYPRNELA